MLAIVVAGCKKSTDVGTVASVGTAPVVTLVTPTSVRVGGELEVSVSSITSNGICWSATNQTPTTSDNKVVVDSLAGIFGGKITGLSPGTSYYARAYAVNSAGTGYGGVIKFTTPTSTFSMQVAVSTFSGSGAFGYADGTAANAQFNGPQAMGFNALTGSFYVADMLNNTLRIVSATGAVSTLTSTERGYVNDDKLTNARFYGARNTVADAAGNIYVADAGNNVIRKITPAGAVSTYAGSATGDYGFADAATPLNARFKDPRGLALDAAGNLYVADYGNNRIRKITPAGVVTTLAGDGLARYVNYTDGTIVSFNGPAAVTVNATGLYVADQNNRAIRKVNLSTGATVTVAGGLPYPEQIGSPQAITTDAANNLYIADASGRILKLTAQSILYTLAGKYNTSGMVNGAGADARFNAPGGLVLDASGRLYVGDFNNNVIRRLVVTVTP